MADHAVMLAPAGHEDVAAATACAAAAFAADPLMHYFFSASPAGVQPTSAQFFTLLMRARLALAMPALVARKDDAVVGLVMGYDTAPPEWPDEMKQAWDAFEQGIPGVPDRFAAYERVADRYAPAQPHYYLGVIGVDPAEQGKGLGKALLDAFCDLSAADTRSSGVYLETGSPESLRFYLRNDFVLAGEDDLGGTRLWCVFRPTP